MTKRALAVLLFAITLPVYADFASIARAIDGHHGVKRVTIPFLGLARVVLWVAHPEGVHDFQLATFEGGHNIDPAELQGILVSQMEPGYKPLVRVWSRRSKEWSFIYAKPAENGTRIELMVLTHDNSDTVLVRVDVDANVLAKELGDPRNVSKVARR